MKINKKAILFITLLSFVLIVICDYINITKYVEYKEHIDSVISNTITFISILIGFISSIYVMIQQTKNSYVLDLLRKNDLLTYFNKSFNNFVFVGFINVLILIFLNFVASNFMIFKIIIYCAFPMTTYFLLFSADIIMTICKMILAEEELKKKDNIIKDDDMLI